MGKKKKWIYPRHKLIQNLACAIIGPYTKLKCRVKVEKLKEGRDRQYLILYNHQTVFDQFFVGMSFRRPIYFVATEDIFSNGFISSLLKYAVAPISIKKQATDAGAVMNMLRVAKDGGTIALAPEGNRTYSGKTEHINPAIAMLAKKMKLPIAIYRIEGGYGVQPRWSDAIRKGRMRSGVSRIIEPSEYKDISAEELNDIICRELYVNEATVDGEFYHKKSAEYLERALYICPKCGLTVLESHNDTVECTKCGLKARYLPTKELEWLNGDIPFRFINDWYEYQNAFVNKLMLDEYKDEPMFEDIASVCEVIPNKKKKPLYKEARVCLYGDRVVIGDDKVLAFGEVTVASVLGRNKLNIYHDGHIYQFKGSKRFNALKYVNIYYRHKNLTRGEINEQFLGL